MNLKIFITVFVSSFLVSFPQNMIGCGPEADPYDYYTSFFHSNLPEANGYRPFYYSSYVFLYDENEPTSVMDLLAEEWSAYCGSPVTAAEAKDFVTEFSRKDINNLYLNIEKGENLPVPDSVIRNGMTQYFQRSKDLEALGYRLYAKQVEPNVTADADSWEAPQRDSLKMGRLIKNGLQLAAVAKNELFKLK